VRGHVFVVQADVTTIACDAWLCPTDEWFSVTKGFREALGVESQHLSGHDWGRQRAIPYRGRSRRNTGIVLGNVGQDELAGRRGLAALVRKLVAVVSAFVDVASTDRNLEGLQRPLKLALPLIGTGHGGLKRFKGDTIRPLLAELNRLAIDRLVDFVLCTATAEAWSAVQSARASGDWALSDEEEEQATVLAREASEGRLVLFIGAGVSRDSGLPDWNDLLEELDDSEYAEEQLRILRQLDLRDRATLIERKLGSRRALILKIKEKLDRSGGSIGLTHALLASLGAQQAITTNYDDLFETACAWRENTTSAQPLAVLPYEVVQQGQPWLLKLHGSLRDSHDSHLQDDIVLTRTDYMRVQRQRGALFGIVQAVLMTKHLLFVGYSLTDEDFHQLVDEIREAMPLKADENRDMRGTVLTFECSPSVELWDDLLGVVAVGKLEDGGARRLQIFLDRVGHAATPHHRHLLEKSFQGLLDKADRDIAAALGRVERKVDGILTENPSHQTASAVRRALEEFGATPTTSW
jgi:SIR2-like domain